MAEKMLTLLTGILSTILAALLIFAGDVLFLGMQTDKITIIAVIFFVVDAIIITVAIFSLTELNPYVSICIAGFLFPFIFDITTAVTGFFDVYGLATTGGLMVTFLDDMFVALQSSVQGLFYSLVIFALIKFALRGK